VFVAELDFGALVTRSSARGTATYRPIERFPRVQRDLAVVVAETSPVGPLLQTVRRAAGPLLRDTGVFDIYRGDRVEPGQKSVAFTITFGADRTLKDREVDKAIGAVVRALETDHGAQLRS
jgi:phenylalanyl-tRNA synthetase beta chain